MLPRRIKIQLAVFAVIAVAAIGVTVFGYIKLPSTLFGVGRYTVTVQLPKAAGLYAGGNVTYRGTEVGRVAEVRLSDTGVEAVLSLRSNQPIPSDLDAEVHSQSGIGEQYVALLPRSGQARPLKNGDVIPANRAKVPPDVDRLLDAANTGLQAIPRDNLRTAIDEASIAVGGLGPDISRLVKGSTKLAIDARAHMDSLTALIDQSAPVLDSQTNTSNAVQQWASHVADIAGQLKGQDDSVAGILRNGGPAADEAQRLLDRLQPTLPVLLANLVSVADVALAYNASLEQLLVLTPQSIAQTQGAMVPNLNTKQGYRGVYLDFNMNLNLPPACMTGFLPPQQWRSPALVDSPDRPPGDFYCRIPQDSRWDIRGARNYPCITRPGKRAATVKLCESDEPYVPLNDGLNWKGDPNATLSGQDVPQLPPGSPPSRSGGRNAGPPPPAAAPPPIAAAPYDPATGTYVAPDGHVYKQSDLSQTAPKEHTWQSMLVPPTNK